MSGGSSAARAQFSIGMSQNGEDGPSGSSQASSRHGSAAARSAFERTRTGNGAGSYCVGAADAARAAR